MKKTTSVTLGKTQSQMGNTGMTAAHQSTAGVSRQGFNKVK